MGMVAPSYFTAEQARALPDDGNRYEVVYGELLVTPAPRPWHQEVVGRLSDGLRAYLRQEPVGHLFQSPADISWGPDTLVQPDLFVVPLQQARTMDWARMTDLLLVTEVLSPSTARADRFIKRIRYRHAGVSLYWVADADARIVEVWTPSDDFPAVERETLRWHPAGASAPFTVSLDELFRPL